MSDRLAFARLALANVPKLLTLQDRNPHSVTYGCFDRNYWHFKIIDFPSGMSQEFVWPLALAWAFSLPDNPYYRSDAIKEWIRAGIHYAALSSRPDGSCDDYYPFERATGAAAFSLLACIESYITIGLDDKDLLDFFIRRADWIGQHRESGQLSNHEALVVLCLLRLQQLIATDRWQETVDHRLAQLLSWQNPEGWFSEYNGCDPGYQTLTISLLARIYEHSQKNEIRDALVSAVRVAAEFVHVDGSFAGEYGSRNTFNFFPHGFELIGKWMPEALSINDRVLQGFKNGKAACYGDDHIVGHHMWNYLLASCDFVTARPTLSTKPSGRVHFKHAGLLIDRRENYELYIALNKGGVFKLFHATDLVASDTQISIVVKDGKRLRNAVCHLAGEYNCQLSDNTITIEGAFGWAKQTQMTSPRLVLLRLVMLSFGRFFPNIIRTILQKLLISGKTHAPFHFVRRLNWNGARWTVFDEVRADTWDNVISVGIGNSQTSIYVVMSRVYQPGQLHPWLDLTDKVRNLKSHEPLQLTRTF